MIIGNYEIEVGAGKVSVYDDDGELCYTFSKSDVEDLLNIVDREKKLGEAAAALSKAQAAYAEAQAARRRAGTTVGRYQHEVSEVSAGGAALGCTYLPVTVIKLIRGMMFAYQKGFPIDDARSATTASARL